MTQIKMMVAAAAAIVMVAGCSSGTHKAPERPTPPPPARSTTAAATTAAASTPDSSSTAKSSAALAGLAGTWNGHYNGSYSGTFTLNWTQSGSDLTGAITLSEPSVTLPIHGTMSNGQIRFGTVGSTAITYTGSVSGSTMSGQYQVAGGVGGTGAWNAAAN